MSVPNQWKGGTAPIAVVMISLNEGHNMEEALQCLKGWAQQVFLVDSFSADDTIDIALHHGVHIVQRRFSGFGDQWNFAITQLPISAAWTMKLDPDERLSEELKASIIDAIASTPATGFTFYRRLWFMGRPLPIRQKILRLWRTGSCRFSDVAVNEHPLISGPVRHLHGDLEHLDSPNLHHWYDKQNKYSTAEAEMSVANAPTSAIPRIMGTSLERRMWLKKHIQKVPGRGMLMFLYYFLGRGLFRAGRVGYIWARLRAEILFMRDIKAEELRLLSKTEYVRIPSNTGLKDPRVAQRD